MDLHPLVVHFPIWLLVLYCLIEIMQVFPVCKKWDLIKTKMILLGVWLIGTYVSIQTWEEAADAYKNNTIVELHEEFAEITFTVFCILAGVYILWYLDKQWYNFPWREIVWKIVTVLFKYWIVALLALGWLFLLTGTWALWWALVYWPDPIAEFILSMLGK